MNFKTLTGLLLIGSFLVTGVWSACTDYGTNASACLNNTDENCAWVSTDEVYFCEDEDCDSNVYNWAIDYVGSSTQYKLYDPCEDNSWIKVKMDDLTEYTSSGTKTNYKQSSFASTSWDNAEAVYGTYQGNNALINTYNATLGNNAGNNARFTLTSVFFTEDSTYNDSNGDVVTVSQNTLKFSVGIEDWTLNAAESYLVLCVGLMTNNGGDVDEDGDTYSIDGFEIDNDRYAQCNGNSNISVTVDQETNGNNHLDICYTFETCVGDIYYDPTVSYTGDSDNSAFAMFGKVGQLVFITLAVVLFVIYQ